MPKYAVVNKWAEKNIDVTLRWPTYFFPLREEEIKKGRFLFKEKLEPIMNDSLSNFNNKVSTVSFSYIPPETFDSLGKEDGIYIVPYVGKDGTSRFTIQDYHDEEKFLFYEEYIRGAVRFSPA